ncbi:hypothetical protein [Lentzea flava]|uniref:Uncharacterized protein n=1 Tax=Lentzea flava TaxID=103732 RepID=A0ABQ2UR67_9PSEU|nr:hypothetical protein [Lentzea flava]MCP2200046.1 hypothetical protein [Lentzea flava]GGU45779.1 hypothetical protein GCM10010178_42800 [Lentzea flava]
MNKDFDALLNAVRTTIDELRVRGANRQANAENLTGCAATTMREKGLALTHAAAWLEIGAKEALGIAPKIGGEWE